jgi:hypothetical protein
MGIPGGASLPGCRLVKGGQNGSNRGLTESVTDGGFTTVQESSETLDGGEAARRNL